MAQIIPVAPFDKVVFGALGDLAKRKLFPALYYRDLDGQIPDGARLIGSGRRPYSDQDFRDEIRSALMEHVSDAHLNDRAISSFLERLSYATINVTDEKGYSALAHLLDTNDPERPQIIYLALSPGLYGDVAKNLAAVGLNRSQIRLVLEKPLGHDLASSVAINRRVGEYFDETQIYRIDHYLGKESVQNLLALRFGNVMFERIWNARNIDHVQITAAETVGLGSRVDYYDKAGALRDMVQNHLLQLMCLTAMEPPHEYEADAIRNEKVKVLKSLRTINLHNIAEKTVRGQYAGGTVNSELLPAYAEELGQSSNTETYVAICAEIENWRWAGVPFYLRTGKRLSQRYTEIVIQFRQVPHSIFGSDNMSVEGNRLVIRLQPDEGVRLNLMTKDPGPGGMRLRRAGLDLSFAEEFDLPRFPDAYERLLLDVVRGNRTLFMRNDEVESAWGWIDPVLDAWRNSSMELNLYPAGTMGPLEADRLLSKRGHSWHSVDDQ